MGGIPAMNSKSFQAWYLLKCLICAEVGMILIALSTINASLSLLIAIPTVPVCTLMHPSKKWYMMQISILIALSPPILAFVFYTIIGSDFKNLIFVMVDYWNLFGAILFPVVVLVYWTFNLAVQVMIGMS
jgi:hypothetical protein